MPNYGQFTTAAAVTAGVVGSACCAYFIYKARKPQLPAEWRAVGTVKAIDVFPVKSCGPVRLDQVECTILGPQRGWLKDRQLMVVDAKNNFITGRGYPELLLTKISIKGSVITLQHPKVLETVDVDLAEVVATQKPENAVLWGITVPVFDCGKQVSDWFTRLLNRPDATYKLACYASRKPRELKLNHNFFKYTKDDRGAFGDDISYSLMNEASVADLNTRLRTCQVTPTLYRANFLVEGPQAYEEDDWKFVKIGGNVFEVIQPCLRCMMTVIEPETGARYEKNEPLEVLKGYRSIEDPELRRAEGNKGRLGAQMALRSGPGGRITQGDTVYVA